MIAKRTTKWLPFGAIVALLTIAGSTAARAADPADDTLVAPSGLHVTGTTYGSVSLAWNPSPAAENVDYYRVNVDGSPWPHATEGTVYQIGGLAPGTTHTFTVQAYRQATIDQSSAPSDPVQATTVADVEPPSTPTNLENSYESPEDVAFSWNRSSDGQTSVSYALFLDSSGTPATEWTTQPSYVFYLSFPAGVHSVAARARDSAGNLSPPSNTVVVNHCGTWNCG